MRLNSARHAVDDLNRMSRIFHRCGISMLEQVEPIFKLFADMLEHSQKFILPDNGDILVDHRNPRGIERYIGLGRVPYPLITIEFACDPRLDADHNSVTHAVSERLGSKSLFPDRRMALVMDVRSPEHGGDQFAWEITRTLRARDPSLDDGLLVWPIDYYGGRSAQADMPPEVNPVWWPGWGALLIPFDQTIKSNAVFSRLRDIDPGLAAQEDHRLPQLRTTLIPMPGYGEQMVQELGEGAGAAVYAESAHEVCGAISLCAALSCRNVSLTSDQAPAGLNKKRSAAKKALLHDYHVLRLSADGISGTEHRRSEPGSALRSVATHLRRGHIRHLPGGNRWINNTIVNPGLSRPRGRDYEIR